MGDQRVRDLGERGLDRLFVLHERAVAFGFGEFHVGLEPPGGEDRLGDLRNEAPGAVRAGEQAGQLRALAAQQSAQADLREIGGLGHADVRVRGDQGLLGGANIGPAFEQRRRQPGGHFGRHLLLHELASADHAAGILPEQQADLVFGLLDLLLQRGNGFRGGADQLLRPGARSSSVATPPPWRSCTSFSDSRRVSSVSLRNLQFVVQLQKLEIIGRRRRSPAW